MTWLLMLSMALLLSAACRGLRPRTLLVHFKVVMHAPSLDEFA